MIGWIDRGGRRHAAAAALTAALLLCLPAPLLASDQRAKCTVKVADASGLTRALWEATDGAVICLRPGTYRGTFTLPGKRVHLRGIKGAARTILDGQGAGPIVTVNRGEGPGTLIEGLTLTNGHASGGGAIWIRGASPTLRNLRLTRNSAEYSGGAVMLEAGASPTLEAVAITGNSATQGGGVAVDAGALLTVRGGVINQNRAKEHGGGVTLGPGAFARLDNVLLQGNTASQHGGAVYMRSAVATFDRVVMRNNAVKDWGGAAFVYSGSAATFRNVIISGNRAMHLGGGVYVEFAAASFANVTVAGNRARGHGGGLRLFGAVTSLTNCALINNQGQAGGGVHNATEAPGNVTATFNFVQGNRPNDAVGLVSTGAPETSKGPIFLAASPAKTGAWDLHLTATSPLKDAGDPSIKDPDGSPSDIGAYGGPGAGGWDLDGDGSPAWWRPGPYNPKTSPKLGLDCDDEDPARHARKGCR